MNQIQAIKALRLALQAVHNSWNDFPDGRDKQDQDPDLLTRSVMQGLVVGASKAIEALNEDIVLAEACLKATIRKCDEVLTTMETEISDARSREYYEKKIKPIVEKLDRSKDPDEKDQSET